MKYNEKYGHGKKLKITILNLKTKITSGTFVSSIIDTHIMRSINFLEYRFLVIFPAIWAKPMRKFGGLLGFLERICKNTRVNFLKFVLGCSLPPLFKFYQLLLIFLILVNERRMFLLECECIDLESKQMFKNLRLSLHDCVGIVRRL